MSTIKTQISQAIKIFGILAIVAAFAAAAFPTRSYAAANANEGKLVVSVYRLASTPASSVALQPLADANIEIYDVNGRSVASATADNNGSITFELPKGLYKVAVSAPGFRSASGTAAVDAGKSTSIKFELASTARITPGTGGR